MAEPSPWKRNILWRAHPARVGLLSPPSLSFCETSALIRERALGMYDPCKHRVPIDQPPLLLGLCAGSRNKGRRKEGRNSPSPTPSSPGSIHGVPLELPPSPFLPSAFGFPLLWPFSIFPLVPARQNFGPNSPLCSAGDFWGAVSKNQGANTSLCTPRDMGGHSECGGVPNPLPLPAQLCVSLNNYSDESITIRPNSHSAELTQIILILCFYR